MERKGRFKDYEYLDSIGKVANEKRCGVFKDSINGLLWPNISRWMQTKLMSGLAIKNTKEVIKMHAEWNNGVMCGIMPTYSTNTNCTRLFKIYMIFKRLCNINDITMMTCKPASPGSEKRWYKGFKYLQHFQTLIQKNWWHQFKSIVVVAGSDKRKAKV